MLGRKDEDLDAYRKQCLELERQLKVKDDKITDLQTQIITLSHDIQEKEMELEFYSTNLEEANAEIARLKQGGAGLAKPGALANTTAGGLDMNEYNTMKAKLKNLMRREVELNEEIELLKQNHSDEKMAIGVKNILDRSKSRGRPDENQGILANKNIDLTN